METHLICFWILARLYSEVYMVISSSEKSCTDEGVAVNYQSSNQTSFFVSAWSIHYEIVLFSDDARHFMIPFPSYPPPSPSLIAVEEAKLF